MEGQSSLVLSLREGDACYFGVVVEGEEEAEVRDLIGIGVDGESDGLGGVGSGQADAALY